MKHLGLLKPDVNVTATAQAAAAAAVVEDTRTRTGDLADGWTGIIRARSLRGYRIEDLSNSEIESEIAALEDEQALRAAKETT